MQTPNIPDPAPKPRTCETCICWHKIGDSPMPRRITYDTGPIMIPPGPEGQCRLGGPSDDFKWPLTKCGDWCASHRPARKRAQE